jgi:hypothetical protein
MTIQLIGAGLGRTGTHALKLALERLLDSTCHHMAEVFGHPEELPAWEAAMRGDRVDWPDVLDEYAAIVDYPGAAVWQDLADAYPEAPILLSTRDSAQTWWDSASATILAARPPEDTDFGRRWEAMTATMFARTLGDDLTDPAAVMAAYDAHNATVRATVPPDRLFEYQPGDGWAPLCAALGLPEPDEPFPHTNSRDEFRKMAGLDS